MPDGAAGHGAPTGRTGPTSGQFSRWGPAQRPAGPRAAHCRPPSRGAGMGPAALQTVSAIPMYGSRRTLGFPPRRNHLGTGGPSRRPPSAGCADRRSAFPCLRVAPPGGMGAMRQFSVRVAPSATRRALPSMRNAGWLDPNRAKRAMFRAFAALSSLWWNPGERRGRPVLPVGARRPADKAREGGAPTGRTGPPGFHHRLLGRPTGRPIRPSSPGTLEPVPRTYPVFRVVALREPGCVPRPSGIRRHVETRVEKRDIPEAGPRDPQ